MPFDFRLSANQKKIQFVKMQNSPEINVLYAIAHLAILFSHIYSIEWNQEFYVIESSSSASTLAARKIAATATQAAFQKSNE